MESLKHIFRSCTEEEMPLLPERLECLRESGRVLCEVTYSTVVETRVNLLM